MTQPIELHEKAVLQFSGGKDSLACLTLLRPWLDRITVLWCNSGDAFPETIAQMAAIREQVPHFLEVVADAPAQIAEAGWPADIVPTTLTAEGRMLDGHARPLMQHYTACCAANLWRPMHAATIELGATLVIRGQRNSEPRKSPIRSGFTHEGIEYWFPLQEWTETRVFEFLREHEIHIPEHYQHTGTSLDCMHCTGWLSETIRTVHWMRSAHPAEHREVARRLRVIRAAAIAEIRTLDIAIHGGV